jgi:hypothetical protein
MRQVDEYASIDARTQRPPKTGRVIKIDGQAKTGAVKIAVKGAYIVVARIR